MTNHDDAEFFEDLPLERYIVKHENPDRFSLASLMVDKERPGDWKRSVLSPRVIQEGYVECDVLRPRFGDCIASHHSELVISTRAAKVIAGAVLPPSAYYVPTEIRNSKKKAVGTCVTLVFPKIRMALDSSRSSADQRFSIPPWYILRPPTVYGRQVEKVDLLACFDLGIVCSERIRTAIYEAELVDFAFHPTIVGDPDVVPEYWSAEWPVPRMNQEAHDRLMAAVREQDVKAIGRMATSGYDINIADLDGCTVLMKAVAGLDSSEMVVRCLLDHGAWVNTQDRVDGFAPLHYAARAAIPEVVKLLLDHGADINVRDSAGFAPVWYSVSFADENVNPVETTRLLLEGGADPEERSVSKFFTSTIDEMARERNIPELVELLKEWPRKP